MKKILLLLLLSITICSCEKVIENLSTVKGGIIVEKIQSHSTAEDKISVRARGRLFKCYVTRYELNNYSLGDTIK